MLTRAVRDSADILVCRLVDGKITYVHRRLWPSLVRIAERFPARRLVQLHEVHTSSGRHVIDEVAFPAWVPEVVSVEAAKLSEEQAARNLGAFLAIRAE